MTTTTTPTTKRKEELPNYFELKQALAEQVANASEKEMNEWQNAVKTMKLLGIHRNTLREWRLINRISWQKRGGRYWYVPSSAIVLSRKASYALR